MTKTRTKPAGNAQGNAAAAKQRRLQQAADRNEKAQAKSPAKENGSKDARPAVQAGARAQPESPMPAEHIVKPGNESELNVAPRFTAPDYLGSGKLAGKVALITGGDSGIGRAIAVLYAREGADVAIVYLDEHDDARVTQHHVMLEGRSCLLLPGDVKQPSFCNHAVEKTVAAFGHLDVLVNNAAFQQHVHDIVDISDEQFDETLRTNVYGYFNMARAAVPHLGEGAAIVNNGSVTGLFGSKHLLDYSATKGAIHAFTRALASNLVEKGVRVNAVAPGPVWTPLNPADRSAEEIAAFGQDNPMGRPAQPEEIAPAFVFLAAPVCSSYISGAVIPVMGGPRG
jgi:NAD(P)-dependent dehydrogenase (short-subunit alcohol dehydrogenase family)